MKYGSVISAVVAALLMGSVVWAETASSPISVDAGDQKKLSFKSPDGGIPPLVGVQTVQVFRCSHDADPVMVGNGGSKWTYNHHTDMAIWQGKLYVAFTNGERDEDTWPSHEVYVTSEDGTHWSKPEELFPQGVSTSLRMYWCIEKGRLLAVAGLRTGTQKLDEKKKGGIVVREVLEDHRLGPVYTLQGPREPGEQAMIPQPAYTTSPDAGFVEACRALLANRPFLEQQDFGRLLGDRRMNAYEGANPDFGRALCFFKRKTAAGEMLIAIGKKGFITASKDGGETWSPPTTVPGLTTGNAKVWVQRMSDGHYAMLYNPHRAYRFPLVIQESDDGVFFSHMRTVNGETPQQRYVGVNRSPGVQYMRGVSIFANDHSRQDKDFYVAYSANKEDIWVSRISVPLKLEETGAVHDTLENVGADEHIANWNTYSPEWAPVTVEKAPEGPALQLEDGDPYDVAVAARVFAESAKPSVSFDIDLLAGKDFEMELRPAYGDAHPVHLTLDGEGVLRAIGPEKAVEVGRLGHEAHHLSIVADCAASTFSVSMDGDPSKTFPFAAPAGSLSRLVFRTGPAPVLPRRATKSVADDVPSRSPAKVRIRNVSIGPGEAAPGAAVGEG